MTKLEAAAKVDVEVAKREETSATRALTVAQQNEEATHWATSEAVEQAKQKMYDANLALDKEKQAVEEKAKADERAAAMQLVIDKIKADAVEKDIDYTEWVELATKALEQGYEAETAINIVRRRYKAAMDDAAKQKEQEVKDAKSGGSSTTSKTIAEGVKQGMANVSVNTNVNTGGVGDGVD